MNRQNVYTILFAFTLILDVIAGTSQSVENPGAGIAMLVASWIFKLGLGLTGQHFYRKEVILRKQETRKNQAMLAPFYIVMGLTGIFTFAMISSAFAVGGGDGMIYMVMIITALVAALAALYYWEIDFIRTVENKVIKVLFAIVTPVTWFAVSIIFLAVTAMSE